VKRTIDGKAFSWDKLDRTATMSKATEQITESNDAPPSAA